MCFAPSLTPGYLPICWLTSVAWEARARIPGARGLGLGEAELQ